MELEEIKEFIISQYRLEILVFEDETKKLKDTKKWTNKAHYLRGKLELLALILIGCFGYSKDSLLEETLEN